MEAMCTTAKITCLMKLILCTEGKRTRKVNYNHMSVYSFHDAVIRVKVLFVTGK
jgi:hypothetical protein